MKKLGWLLGSGLLLAVLLAGCTVTISTGNEEAPPASSTAAPAAEQTPPPAQAEGEAFRQVAVKVQAGSLHIRTGEEFSFLYADGSRVSYSVEEGTLVCEASFTHHEGLLTLPEGAKYSGVSISVGAGHIYVEDSLQTSTFDLELDGGEASVLGLQAEDASTIRVEKGSVYLTGRLGGQVLVECTNGNVSLALEDAAADYDYDISINAGSVSLDGHCYGGMTNQQIDNGAGRTMKLSCKRGAMEIGTR